MDRIVNLLIFAITAALMPRLFRREGRFSADAGRRAFRFFTVQSNAFCALSALLMALAPGARWAWLLKYVGTAAVSVTMLTVLLFLGPSAGYRAMLKGPDFFMHLVSSGCPPSGLLVLHIFSAHQLLLSLNSSPKIIS